MWVRGVVSVLVPARMSVLKIVCRRAIPVLVGTSSARSSAVASPAAEPEFGEEAPVLQAGEGVLADCPLGRDQLVDLPAPTGRTMVWETSLAAAMSQRRWSWQRTARTMVAIFPGGSLRHRERIFLSWPCRRSPMSPRGGRGQVQTGLVDSFFGVPAGRLFFFTSSSTSAGGQLVTPGGIGTGRW